MEPDQSPVSGGASTARWQLRPELRTSAHPGAKVVYYEGGNLTLMGVQRPSNFKVSGKGQYIVSLVWMPFASKWSEASWYR